MHSSTKSTFKRAWPFAFRQFPEDYGRPTRVAETKAETDPSESENLLPETAPARYSLPGVLQGGVSMKSASPSHCNMKSARGPTTSREKVIKVLESYHEMLDKLLKENETNQVRNPNIYKDAAIILQKQHKWVEAAKRLGSVPGVEIGDKFQFRAELCVVGVHCQFERGIDYMKKDGIIVATSIVATDRYANEMKSSGELIYCGEGGNPNFKSGKPIKDHVLERGNLALKNSMLQRTPVRVILSENCKRSKLTALRDTPQQKNLATSYVYDGLYNVEELWQERGEFGKLVFKFRLRRIGQPGLIQGFPGKHKKVTPCKRGPLINDISRGKEKMPIAVVNEIDEQRPSLFTYISKVTYPQSKNRSILSGCNCTSQCSDYIDCSCKVKNGQEFPYDNRRHLIKEKPYVYECGNSCKCSDSCINRVSQLGIQFQLEVFKTKSKGWGVRSRSYIPSGSFVCEYVGEILSSKEAEQRVGSRDGYLFHMEDNRSDRNFKEEWKPLGKSHPSNFSEKVTIDAAQYGNVARFINHSCSPNLHVQKVIYDDHEMPHLMLFANKDIPAWKELTYDYKYRLGELCHINGNFKAKECFCSSLKCVGKFY
ncbi:histone-lysine N-methyltransferase, H3 lysine-9 specific SUVH5 [Jatropha curcas]|nr:histone-lysine N-methyltransferase, H3 lysine-9 specific SUVH5 [Jatropha curcas]